MKPKLLWLMLLSIPIGTLLGWLILGPSNLTGEQDYPAKQSVEELPNTEFWEEARRLSPRDKQLLVKLELAVSGMSWATETQEYPYDRYTGYSGEVKFEMRRWHGSNSLEDSTILSVYLITPSYGGYSESALLLELPEEHALTQAAVLSYHLFLERQAYLESRRDSIEAARREQTIRELRDKALEAL